MKVLALDPATHTGWAHSDGPSGVWDLSPGRDESRGMRLVKFRARLRAIDLSLGIDLVVFESVMHASIKNQATAMVVQSEIQGVLKHYCETNNIEYSGVPSSAIKKHATGKGNASKELMVQYAEQWFPDTPITDDNHADALHILRYANEVIL